VILTERSEVDGGSRRQPAVSFARWQETPCIEPLFVVVVGALGVAAARAMVDPLATFLARISRAESVEAVGKRTGRYRLLRAAYAGLGRPDQLSVCRNSVHVPNWRL
jgi:hypothetical protein